MGENNFKILEGQNLILIRYTDEIWLKSTKVKMRMINILIENIKKMLERNAIKYHKYQLSKDATRVFFFFKNEDLPHAIEVIEKVFGIYSISPAIRTSNRMENILERILEVGRKILKEGDSFAIRVKRAGEHSFTSQDVARRAGRAVLDEFSDLNLTVDLGAPDKIIYIEVRGEFSYIFTDIIKTQWKGLPVNENRSVMVMDNGRMSDLLAGLFLMRRGCNISPIFFTLTNKEEEWTKRISNWRHILQFSPYSDINGIRINLTHILNHVRKNSEDLLFLCGMCRLIRFKIIEKLLGKKLPGFEGFEALTDGITWDHMNDCPNDVDLQSIQLCNSLLFTPLIGLDVKEIENHLSSISEELGPIHYCKYTPEDQQFDSATLQRLYNSLDIERSISRAIKNKTEIVIR